jgi:hypothetical protein
VNFVAAQVAGSIDIAHGNGGILLLDPHEVDEISAVRDVVRHGFCFR